MAIFDLFSKRQRRARGEVPDVYVYDKLPQELRVQIVHIIKEGVIDFATYKRFQLSTGEVLLQHYEDSFKSAVQALQQVSDDKLEDQFVLQNSGQQLMSSSKKESIGSSINHWVHHRGQLTVYMRLNDIPVPSIYGPSADDRTF